MENVQPYTRTSRERLPYAARALFPLLSRLRGGTLTLQGPGAFRETFGERDGALHARLTVDDWDVLVSAARSGDIGFAQSYIEGRWHTDNLPGLIELVCRNRDTVEAAMYGSRLGGLLYRLRHLLNANSRRGARRNIAAHYDLGNDFYALWLDPSMTYSSALFGDAPGLSLEEAQLRKYRRVLDTLGVRAGEHLLEIGCGWGGLAEVAARDYGARVTGLTLSKEQLAYAQARMWRAGLAGQVELRLQDYRDLHGQFDHIASIEMFEAVGEAYWPGYFECLKRNLKPGGGVVVQSITIADAVFPRYRQGTDFIQQYIFPGGMLPSPAEFHRQANLAGLRFETGLAFGADYARTLRHWRLAFLNALPAVRAQGKDERFMRLWEFYLAYCEGAFAAGSTDVVHFDLRPARS